MREYPTDLALGIESTLLEPGQVALVLDKDYAGEYDLSPVAPEVEPILVTTTSGNLYLANSSDRVALLDSSEAISDDYSWTHDVGNDVAVSRARVSGDYSELVIDPEGFTVGYIREQEVTEIEPPSDIYISELLPDPVGSDEAEFIELVNLGDTPAQLMGLELSDTVNTFAFSEQVALEPEDYLVISKSESGIQLNNSGDEISLSFEGEVLDTTHYENPPEGQSWSRFDNEFYWTSIVTRGFVNEQDIEPPTGGKEDSEEEISEGSEVTYEILKQISDIDSFDEGDRVSVRGVVATNTGLFYKNTFHLVDESGGVMVTLDRENPNVFKVGSSIKIQGEIDDLGKMPRIKLVETPEVLGKSPLPIKILSVGEIDQDNIGQIVNVSAQVTRRSGKSFRISEAKQKDEILVSVRKNSGITKNAPPKNQMVQVTGIVLASGENVVVAPRSAADLKTDNLLPSGPSWPVASWWVWSLFLAALSSFGLTFWSRRRALHLDQ